MIETWYVLEDGGLADPSDVVNDGGRLRHADGRFVAMRFGEVPSTRSVDADAERAKVKPEPKANAVIAKPAGTYNTRDMKARR